MAPETETLTAEQTQAVKDAKDKEDKDEKYKTDKTGQYVSKEVQVTGYEGAERPTRPKYDATNSEDVTAMVIAPIDPGTGGGGGTPPAPTSKFVSSVGIGCVSHPAGFYTNIDNVSMDLKIRKGSSSTINTSDLPGYYKIPVDLNKGAGGQYIYLCFTRDPNKVQGSDSGQSAWVNSSMMGRSVSVKNIVVKSYSVGGFNSWPTNCSPPIEAKDDLGFHTPDLNDGSGGKYIYAYQEKCTIYSPNTVMEVGVIYGNSSSFQPPNGWIKIPGDLNEGAERVENRGTVQVSSRR
ncbi:hypothetical protein ACFSKU_07565 [Pontibacter silvestris]|uniref:Uncharacterized protein n=1 Tax=Pontibacter silvestris TaxID=2305183 RepID=A0ABW4WVG8_9BACT|nr:hypothetical protein [Pontibacter silvestris]MCC9136648.1 hypothetical protein [Pontibacter silvestris]